MLHPRYSKSPSGHLIFGEAFRSCCCLQIQVKAEAELPGVSNFLNSLKWDVAGLVTVIAQVRSSQN